MADTTEPGDARQADASKPALARAADTPRRSVTALVAAALLIAGVVAAVLIFGVVRAPELAGVGDGPAPSAAVAFSHWDDGESCVNVVWPDGRHTTPYCATDSGDVLAWSDAGIVVTSWTPAGQTEAVIDPETGAVLERRAVDPNDPVDERAAATERAASGDEWVRGGHVDGRLVVRFEVSGDVLWDVEAPEAYNVTSGVVSPDGQWVALVDTADRLLVVDAAATAPPRVWATGIDEWQTIVWQGSARD